MQRKRAEWAAQQLIPFILIMKKRDKNKKEKKTPREINTEYISLNKFPFAYKSKQKKKKKGKGETEKMS